MPKSDTFRKVAIGILVFIVILGLVAVGSVLYRGDKVKATQPTLNTMLERGGVGLLYASVLQMETDNLESAVAVADRMVSISIPEAISDGGTARTTLSGYLNVAKGVLVDAKKALEDTASWQGNAELADKVRNCRITLAKKSEPLRALINVDEEGNLKTPGTSSESATSNEKLATERESLASLEGEVQQGAAEQERLRQENERKANEKAEKARERLQAYHDRVSGALAVKTTEQTKQGDLVIYKTDQDVLTKVEKDVVIGEQLFEVVSRGKLEGESYQVGDYKHVLADKDGNYVVLKLIEKPED